MADSQKQEPKEDAAVEGVAVEPVYPSEGMPIRFVNFVRFTQIGNDMFLDWGVVDDQKLAATLKEATPGPRTVRAYVQGRFGMSVQGFLQLLSNAHEMAEKMVAAGALPKNILDELKKS